MSPLSSVARKRQSYLSFLLIWPFIDSGQFSRGIIDVKYVIKKIKQLTRRMNRKFIYNYLKKILSITNHPRKVEMRDTVSDRPTVLRVERKKLL